MFPDSSMAFKTCKSGLWDFVHKVVINIPCHFYIEFFCHNGSPINLSFLKNWQIEWELECIEIIAVNTGLHFYSGSIYFL